MGIEPIKNDHGYRRALKEIERLMMAKAGTPEGRRLAVLARRVEAWERQHHRIDEARAD